MIGSDVPQGVKIIENNTYMSNKCMRMFPLRSFIEGVIKLEGDPTPVLGCPPSSSTPEGAVRGRKKGFKIN